MIKVEDIKKIVESIILTGYIKNKDRNPSLFIIAEVESGKTQIIKMFKEYPNIFMTSDISYKGMVDDIMPKFEDEKISHLLIPDFINPLSHKRACEILIPLMNSLIEEGVKDLKVFGSKRTFSKTVKGSIISSITKQLFERRIVGWRHSGFLTRVLPLTFKYSQETIHQINESIMKGEYYKQEEKFNKFEGQKLNSIIVNINEDIADKISLLADQINRSNKNYILRLFDENTARMSKVNFDISTYGFRFHKLLRTLFQGIALYNSEDIKIGNIIIEATKKDFEDLVYLTKYLNFNFEEI